MAIEQSALTVFWSTTLINSQLYRVVFWHSRIENFQFGRKNHVLPRLDLDEANIFVAPGTTLEVFGAIPFLGLQMIAQHTIKQSRGSPPQART